MTPNKLEKFMRRAMKRSRKNLEPTSKMLERMQGLKNEYRRQQLTKLYK